jgi:hypothetical protein
MEATEWVPYTRLVRPGGTEPAAPCRRRETPGEDAASTQKQGFQLPPWKLEDARGASRAEYCTGTREQDESCGGPQNPPATTAGQEREVNTQPARSSSSSPPWPTKGSLEPADLVGEAPEPAPRRLSRALLPAAAGQIQHGSGREARPQPTSWCCASTPGSTHPLPPPERRCNRNPTDSPRHQGRPESERSHHHKQERRGAALL